VVAALALLSGFIRTIVTRNEVGARYRPAVVARLAVTAIATLSYVLILISFSTGYHRVGSEFVPNAGALLTFATRYMDWSVTVPLLAIELLAICAIAGVAVRRAQYLAMSFAFLMVFSGFVGAFLVEGSAVGPVRPGPMLLWGAISCVFWFATVFVLVRAVRTSLASLTPASATTIRQATVLLLSGWIIYPVVYFIPLFAGGGAATTTIQIILCAADVMVKIGFGGLTHHAAKLRTAEDVRAGDDVHHEAIWISSVKQSDAGSPREVYLAQGAAVHVTRVKPPTAAAVADSDNDTNSDQY
jgi:bacteriorhodopsin